ncbi:MAG: putative phage tail protein [Firmicutes bacterium]|nr:putative phage tail protein [Bacillota bacterium]
MSKTVYDVTLLELLPENLRSDPDIIAASQAVDTEYRALVSSIKNCLTIADVDNACSDVVDNLAGEIQVDFYDQTLSLDVRRALVKNGYIYKYQKGTAYAVKQIVEDAGLNASLKEWFEYDGEPYYFKVTTETVVSSTTVLAELAEMINSVKNIRSWLEGIIINRTWTGNMYFGTALVDGKMLTLFPKAFEMGAVTGTTYFGTALVSGKVLTLKEVS